MTRAVFLDRDGVIVEDLGFAHKIEDCHVLPGATAGLKRLQQAGFLLVITTNQSGIGRGYYTEADYHRFTDHMLGQLATEGVTIDAVMHCPHAPEADCDCRKPRPGMLLQAAGRHGIDLGSSYMVGDRGTDLDAAAAAGLRGWVLVTPPGGSAKPGATPPLYTAADLAHAAEWIVSDAAGPAGN